MGSRNINLIEVTSDKIPETKKIKLLFESIETPFLFIELPLLKLQTRKMTARKL